MIKVIFALALLGSTLFCASSAQRPQTFFDEVEAAVEEFFSEAVIFTETELESSYIIGEYDWVLTDNSEGQVEVSVHTVPASDATNLEGALTDLIEKLGEAIQDRADEIETELEGLTGTEEDVNEVQQENDPTAANIRQFGSELQANASQISATLVQNYNRAAVNYTYNDNDVTNRLNSALNSIYKYKSGDPNLDVILKAITDTINIRDQIPQLGSEIGAINSAEDNKDTESVNSENISGVTETVAVSPASAANSAV